MRWNKQELAALGAQPSHKFDKEGLLLFYDRHDGFFRRTESCKTDHSKNQKDGKREKLRDSLSCVGVTGKVCCERWCRLRGNLLFYLRTGEQWSQPMGVIVLEQCSIVTSSSDQQGHFPFNLVWEGGLSQQLATLSEQERVSWIEAIQFATYECMRSQLLALQDRLEKRRGTDPDIDIHMWRLQKGLLMDINEVPLCELSLSCDNLLCDAHGHPPSPLLIIHVKLKNTYWIRYAATEVVEKSSNPTFFSTVTFRGSDGIDGDTRVRITAYDMRERISQTTVVMGSATILLNTIQDTQRLRIALTNRENSTVGFLTLNGWCLEPANVFTSPHHSTNQQSTSSTKNVLTPTKVMCHRRSQSLPPRLGVKLKLPSHGSILKNIMCNSYQVTYRFHSGLGGDITVHEIMAESKLCFMLPQQLLGIWIQREKELLQEVLCMGELGGPWKSKQMYLLDTHLALLKYYSHGRQNLQNYVTTTAGKYFKQSTRKGDATLEFAPTNLHIQRMWVHNDTLNKSGFYDFITVGAFTAHCQKYGSKAGLFKLMQQMKNVPSENFASSSRLSMASDAVQTIKQLRGEVVTAMRGLLQLAKKKESTGMIQLAEEMVVKTRTLLSLWDPGLVEDALSFIDKHKVPPVVEQSPSSNNRPQVLSPFKRLTHQLNLLDLKSPDIEDFATPSTPQNNWPPSDPSTCNYKKDFNIQREQELKFHQHLMKISDDQLSTGDLKSLNFCIQFDDTQNENNNGLSSEDQSNDAAKSANESIESDISTNQTRLIAKSTDVYENYNKKKSISHSNSESKSSCDDDSANLNDVTKQFLDIQVMSSSPSANYYQPTDEPEPWDLTQLNVEASVMCLVSKVKFLCGRCGSPAVRLRGSKSAAGANACIVTNQPSHEEVSSSLIRRSQERSNKSTIDNLNKNTDSPVEYIHIPLNVRSKETADQTNKNISEQSSHKSVDVINKNKNDVDEALNKTVDTVNRVTKKGNKFTDGLNLADVSDWVAELRPSMRKLRQAMDGLLKGGRLAHAVLRIRQEQNALQQGVALQIRRDVCFSQALTSLVTGVVCWLWSSPIEVISTILNGNLSPLCCSEGLLSLHGAEQTMYNDMLIAIEDLQTVIFCLHQWNHSEPPIPQITGSRASLTILVPVPNNLYALLNEQATSFTITPVFFNIGINEMATLAESLGLTGLQDKSNIDNFERINEYYLRYRKLNVPSINTMTSRVSSGLKPLQEIIENLRAAVYAKTSKNVDVLQLAAHATRRMNGIKMTSCKSAKDRTGMSCTLEECQILSTEYHLAEHEFNRALDCMRSEGCRRENTYKNTGIRKYAFNKLQLIALPKSYRPPPGTYGSVQT